MRKTFRLLVRGVVVAFYLFLINVVTPVLAIEFQKEADKAQWIKEFFKDKEFEPLEQHFALNATEEEKTFERRLFKDFITQKGIEHVEPIARGKSIDDPEIAKFNKACPNKKPINEYREWKSFSSLYTHEASEEELVDPENAQFVFISKCRGDFKIYKFNLYNMAHNIENYVLYCTDFRTIRSFGELKDENRKMDPSYIEDGYLVFYPDKCKYPKRIYISDSRPLMPNSLTGVFRYQDYYYLFVISEGAYSSVGDSDDRQITIGIESYYTTENKKFYFYYSKPIK
jgi:hypothetical protein